MVVGRGLVRTRDTKRCGKLGRKRKLHTLMLKILEACTYLAKLGLRSFGVFLVLHMVEKTSSEGSSELPHCVYSLHGIRTDAFWQSGLSEQIRTRTGFKVGYRNYLRFELLMFVLKNIFSYKPLHLIAG